MLVFSGGVVRDGDAYYMMAFLTISLINKPVYMWGGYSYSSDHVTRDMLGFNSDGDYFDLYSLLAGAPYLDSSENVKGNNDLKMISNSAKNNLGTDIFHYVHLYRLFNTMDSFGD